MIFQMQSLKNFILKNTGVELAFEINYLTRFLPFEPVYLTSGLTRLKCFRVVCSPLCEHFPLRGHALTTSND